MRQVTLQAADEMAPAGSGRSVRGRKQVVSVLVRYHALVYAWRCRARFPSAWPRTWRGIRCRKAASRTDWRDHYDDLRLRPGASATASTIQPCPRGDRGGGRQLRFILKSPTVLRQSDGRLWCWEGCSDNSGCCAGSCTHVWNYAQAIPHLFPALERTRCLHLEFDLPRMTAVTSSSVQPCRSGP